MAQATDILYSFSHISIFEDDIEDINSLLGQISNRPSHLTSRQLLAILGQPNFFLWAVRNSADNHIVALATLIIYETLTRRTGVINDVVVDQNHRGKGLGRNSVRTLITFAKVKGLDCLDLTSNPERIDANKLYVSMGFKKRDTNSYRLTL